MMCVTPQGLDRFERVSGKFTITCSDVMQADDVGNDGDVFAATNQDGVESRVHYPERRRFVQACVVPVQTSEML